MKKIKIFLASSEELKEERLELAGLVNHMNFALEKSDIKIYLVKWEYLDSSMSPIHKQEEYNRTLEKCDMCMVLYWTRFGKYTKAELDTAYRQISNDSSKKLCVCFKNSNDENNEIADFKKQLESEYKLPFYTFNNEKELKREFLHQFDTIQKENLNNQYPVTFSDKGVYLNGEKLTD